MSVPGADRLRPADRVRDAGPRPLDALADLTELLGGDTHRSRRFLGGLAVGALVGAAIAGTSLLRQRAGRTPPGRG